MSESANVIKIAKAEVGFREGSNNRQKYSPAVPGLEWSQNQPWCATFVAWCAMKAGIADLFPRTASCDVAGGWFKERGLWSDYPAIGAQVFFGYPSDLNHTGIVYDYDATYIYTVEGNTNDDGSREGNGVYLKKRERRGTNVIGYGYPQYAEGIKSADPAFQDDEPEPKPDPTRGKNIDAALKDLRKAHPAEKNRSKVRKAIEALKSIKPWNKK